MFCGSIIRPAAARAAQRKHRELDAVQVLSAMGHVVGAEMMYQILKLRWTRNQTRGEGGGEKPAEGH